MVGASRASPVSTSRTAASPERRRPLSHRQDTPHLARRGRPGSGRGRCGAEPGRRVRLRRRRPLQRAAPRAVRARSALGLSAARAPCPPAVRDDRGGVRLARLLQRPAMAARRPGLHLHGRLDGRARRRQQRRPRARRPPRPLARRRPPAPVATMPRTPYDGSSGRGAQPSALPWQADRAPRALDEPVDRTAPAAEPPPGDWTQRTRGAEPVRHRSGTNRPGGLTSGRALPCAVRA